MPLLETLRTRLRGGESSTGFVVGAIVDSGLLAGCAVAGGADFLLGLSATPFRQRGISRLGVFLPYRNANEVTERLLSEHLYPWTNEVPVVAGMFAGDPRGAIGSRVARWIDLGASGICNYPSVTMLEGPFRQLAAGEGATVESELEMLREASALGNAAIGFVRADCAELESFAMLDLDALILHVGITDETHDVVQKRDRLAEIARELKRSLQRIRAVNRSLPCLMFGGAMTRPEDLQQVDPEFGYAGFVGGSVFCSMPIEKSVPGVVRSFKERRQISRAAVRFGEMVGTSESMLKLYAQIERCAEVDLNICIEGESGTGKELVATQIHRMSQRQDGPLVTLNCGAIPDALLESELFGHERGAFTGAERRRLGKFELSNGGTLFLDEVADLSYRGQVALLRALQQREIIRLGGEAPIEVDCRILSASNQPLLPLVEAGKFRADLYYRLNHLTIQVPPMRERGEDIARLAEHTLGLLRVQMKRNDLALSPQFLEKLAVHGWPGNIRELAHVLGQAILLEDGPLLQGVHFQPKRQVAVHAEERRSRNYQRACAALAETQGNKQAAAHKLGISRKTLYRWLDAE